MGQSTTARSGRHFSAHASLAGIGVLLRQRDVCGPIRARGRIAQKTVRHTPREKLYDGFVAILSGAHGLVEINTRLRGDPTLQRAMGRAACAEQSVVQQTLDACTEENVAQMHDALDDIYRQQGAGYRHDYTQAWQVLDGDMSGLPCHADPRPPSPPRAILPSSATGAGGRSAAWWRVATTRSWWTASSPARRNWRWRCPA